MKYFQYVFRDNIFNFNITFFENIYIDIIFTLNILRYCTSTIKPCIFNVGTKSIISKVPTAMKQKYAKHY